MVKGISRQVIVVHSPDPKLFEQAIFILREDQKGITDEVLLKEANRLISKHHGGNGKKHYTWAPLWAAAGALFTGIIWLTTLLL